MEKLTGCGRDCLLYGSPFSCVYAGHPILSERAHIIKVLSGYLEGLYKRSLKLF